MPQALTTRRKRRPPPQASPATPAWQRPVWPINLVEQTTLQEVLHEPYADPRDKIILSLIESPYPTHQRWAQSMATCCCTARFYIDRREGKVTPWLCRCRHRLCPLCGRRRARQVSAQVLTILQLMACPRMIVLTVKANTKPLREQCRDLRQWFAKLRRQPFWKHAVAGGVYTHEITRNEETGLWHPHINIIYDGFYLPHKQLQFHWHQITGHSEIVWIQQVYDRPNAAHEISKYVGKPQHVSQLPPHAIREYASATCGMRFVQTFGHTWNKRVKDQDTNEPIPRDEYSVTLPHIMHVAACGHAAALHLAVTIADRFPSYSPYIYHLMPQLQPEPTRVEAQLAALARLRGVAAPVRAGPRAPPDHEKLDMHLFAAFNRFRLEAEAGVYEASR